MGRKRGDNKKPKKVVLSLAEFNEDAGLGGVDPELSSLPSAPKAAEEWEALGGRPEYNSRGYKERQPRHRDYDNDGDFEDRDWARRGPLDTAEGNGFGTGPERDWSDMRRGPLDAPEGHVERDWNDMRRGPVESAFGGGGGGGGGGGERDWSLRKGPIEADLGHGHGGRVISDDSWGTRKGPVEAEFRGGAAAERDWSVRKGPVEAGGRSSVEQADWGAMRRGPVESEFASESNVAGRDWGQRKGPVEAAQPGQGRQTEADWGEVRRGPVEAENAERDWSMRRGPVETEMETVEKAVRDIDFGEMRRGAKLEELKEAQKAREASQQKKVEMEDRWRRGSVGVVGRSGGGERTGVIRPASTGHDSAPKERDWGAARRAQPVMAEGRNNRMGPSRVVEVNKALDTEPAEEEAGAPIENEEESDWTTVRSAGQRRSAGGMSRNRHTGKDNRGSFPRRGGPARDFRGEKQTRSQMNGGNKATSSPVSPVAASAVPEP